MIGRKFFPLVLGVILLAGLAALVHAFSYTFTMNLVGLMNPPGSPTQAGDTGITRFSIFPAPSSSGPSTSHIVEVVRPSGTLRVELAKALKSQKVFPTCTFNTYEHWVDGSQRRMKRHQVVTCMTVMVTGESTFQDTAKYGKQEMENVRFYAKSIKVDDLK